MGTPRRHHMLALRLPGNVERTANRIRDLLFSATAALSTQGIPPVLPVAYVTADLPEEVVNRLPQTRIPPIRTGTLVATERGVAIGVRWPEEFSGFLASVESAPSPDRMPQPLSGIFLGGSDLAATWSDIDDAARNDVELELSRMPRQVSAFVIELISLDVADTTEWWEVVDWEVRWSRRIKLRGQMVTT